MLTVQRSFLAWGVVGLLLAAAGPVHAEIVRPDDLAGWWKLGEDATFTAGRWVVPDASGNGNTAMSVGMEQADRIDGYAFDPYPETSRAMQFNESSHSSCNTAYDASLVMGSSFTVAAWVRMQGYNGGDRIIAGRLDSRLRHNFFFQLDNKKANVGFHDGVAGYGWPKVSGSTVLSDGQWYHVAGVFDDAADMLKVYVNGQLDGSRYVSGAPSTSSAHGFSIGANEPEGNRWINGSIDDVRLYNVALAPEEIAAIYNGGGGDFQPVPEPATWLMLAIAIIGALACTTKRRRRFVGVVLAAAGWMLLAGQPAAAESIALNAVGPSDSDWDHDGIEVHVTQTAGVIPQDHWNNMFNGPAQHETQHFDKYKNRTGSLGNLLDSDGAATGASVGWNTSFYTWDIGIPRISGDHQLMHGYLDASENQPVTITVQNLPPSFLNGYDVYVYHETQSHWGEGRVGRLTIGNQTLYARDMAGRFHGTFYEDSYTSLAEAQAGPGGNYVVFRGLTDPSFTLEAIAVWKPAEEPFNRIGIQGLQIVATEVPEPATALLLACGGLAMSIVVVRQRQTRRLR